MQTQGIHAVVTR